MNSRFYQNIELTCTAIAWRHSFSFHFFSEGKLSILLSILTVVGYIFKGKCSQKPDLVSQSGCKQNCHFNIPHISHIFFPKMYLKMLSEIHFEIPAKGWICFWKSISFPLRFFWLFSRELLFFGNILLLFVPQQPPRHCIVARCFLSNRHCWFFSPIVQI